MAWYSLLPSYLNVYEYWIARIFVVLAIINISPWLIAILYDIALYLYRHVYHEFPIWGGRARGEQRPSAPNLRDRARGARSMSITGMIVNTGRTGGGNSGDTELRERRPA